MPTISMFYGLIIRMYFAPLEHNPPHIHVYYQELEATFSIQSGDILNGELPKNKIKLIQAWIEIHYEELMANWTLCQNGELPFNIDALK
ncbi:MAG: DUF4160 domain-containing protein [Alphaproteobacteria bacterium]|nr:DUF4160 domain-containing protein [Alphaproteobacteria bacterium]